MSFTGVTKNLLIGVITRFITGRETSCSFSVFFQKSWMKKMLTVGQVHVEMRVFANFVGRAVSMSSPKYQNMRRLFAGSNQEPHKKIPAEVPFTLDPA